MTLDHPDPSAAPPSFDYAFQRWVERTYARQERPLRFTAETLAAWQSWHDELRAKILELSGMVPPPEHCELEPYLADSTELHEHGVVREKVVYQSEPDVWVPAYLLRPLNPPTERLPAILALHGHGGSGRWGKEQVAGAVEESEAVRQRVTTLNYDYGLQFAKRGYVALVPDARLFGERAGGWWKPGDPPRSSDPCDRAGNKAALLGYALISLTAWDDQRGIDYLQSRADVDPERIGVAGLSLGGTRTMYVAALDDRAKATVISGYFGTFQALLNAQFCGGQYVPGLLRWADLPDVTALIAPRPLLIEAGVHDQGFPIAASREGHETLKRVYRLHGAEDRLWRDEFDGGHRWNGQVAYDFMDQYLSKKEGNTTVSA